jgi:pilus assembly protein CpaB
MDRRTRTIVVVVVAIVCASIASASVYRAITRMPVREVEVAHTYVVMSARALPLGTRIASSDVKRVGWPSSTPLTGAHARIEDVVGRGIVTPLGPNEPITESKLAPRDAGAGLAPAIPAGMRAISIKVNEVIGVAGFATPGARVDVLVTLRRGGDAVSRVLLANVPVLTAGTRYDQEKATQTKPIPSTVVTLMVTPAQAERIALATTEGNITLMLRNPLDIAEPATPGAQLTRLADGIDGTATAVVAPRPVREVRPALTHAAGPAVVATAGRTETPAPAAYTVEAIRAGKRTQETIP